MYKPRKNSFVFWFFSGFIKILIRTHFKEFKIHPAGIDPNRSILLLSNHFSWWDGFFLFYLNKVHLKKKFHIMITEENYNKAFFFKYLGAFGIKKKSRSIFKALNYSAELLQDPDNLVVIFPQGKLNSNHCPEVVFERGLEKIINSTNKSYQYLFVSMFVDYFEHRKPSVFCYLQKKNADETGNFREVEAAFNNHYKASLKYQTEIKV